MDLRERVGFGGRVRPWRMTGVCLGAWLAIAAQACASNRPTSTSETGGSAGTPAGTGGASGGVASSTGGAMNGGAGGALGVTGSGGAGGTLQKGLVTAVPAPSADVLIVLDRSGSMNEGVDGMTCADGGCGETSKWAIVTRALTAALPATEASINWGLKFFASPNGSNSSCTVSSGVEVAPSTMNTAPIVAAIEATVPMTSTPTTAAVTAAATYLQTVADGTQKLILLVTDGVPTCGQSPCPPGTNLSTNSCDDANAIAAVQKAHDQLGIGTLVIGVGTSTAPGDATLSAMAMAGGYPVSGAATAYYAVGGDSDLQQAFAAIGAVPGKCFFRLEPAIDPAHTPIESVQADGVDLPASAYAVMGPSGIQLIGQTCTDYLAGKVKTIAAVVRVESTK